MKRMLLIGTPLLALTLAAGLIAAGCGGDDDEGDGSASITRQEWIAQANAICRKGDREMERAGQKYFAASKDGSRPDREAEQEYLEEVVAPGVTQQVEEIAALPRPEGDEEQIAEIVDAAEEGVETVNANPRALFDGDPLKKATRLITAYGVTECG